MFGYLKCRRICTSRSSNISKQHTNKDLSIGSLNIQVYMYIIDPCLYVNNIMHVVEYLFALQDHYNNRHSLIYKDMC